MARRRTLATALFIATTLATGAHAEPVKLVTGNDYKPFTDAELNGGGLVTTLVEAAYDVAGKETTVSFTSWKRAEHKVLNGEARATFPHVKTKPRLKKFAYSDPIFVNDVVPVVKPKNADSYTGLAALKGGHTCMPFEWSFGHEKLDQWAGTDKLKVERPDSMTTCYKLLDAGRVDFIVADAPTVPFDAREVLGSADKVHREAFTLTRGKLHVMFDKDASNAEAKVAAFNEALTQLKESGRYDEIVHDYLEQGGATR